MRQLTLIMLEDTVEGKLYLGELKRPWMDDIKQWMGEEYIKLQKLTEDRNSRRCHLVIRRWLFLKLLYPVSITRVYFSTRSTRKK